MSKATVPFKIKDECPECKGVRGKWVDSKWKLCETCKGKGVKKTL